MPSKKPSKKELQAQICSLQDVVAEAHDRIDALDTQSAEALKILQAQLNYLEALVKGLCNAK